MQLFYRDYNGLNTSIRIQNTEFFYSADERLSVPELSEGTEVSKMAIREGIVFWVVGEGGVPHV